ncbi:MAG: AAA family ATPase, partial [Acidobacteria bacterium]|nr:AAA family ATPase [Acidobacteriota bacterium]
MQEQLEHVRMTKEQAWELIREIEEQVELVVIGQETLVRKILIGLFGRIPYSFRRGEGEKAGSGHILLEGVPGLAKTLLVSALANTIRARFQRIQFTPDMLPADILGTRIFDSRLAEFRTEKGPIFANIVLADEINRASQKTQSALLEAMQERQVTIGENTYTLDDPFWVLATQNPVEQEGVFTLPEAQLDRFAMMIRVHYPSPESEFQMLLARLEEARVNPVADPQAVVRIRQMVSQVHVDDKVRRYIVAIGRATRDS